MHAAAPRLTHGIGDAALRAKRVRLKQCGSRRWS